MKYIDASIRYKCTNKNNKILAIKIMTRSEKNNIGMSVQRPYV